MQLTPTEHLLKAELLFVELGQANRNVEAVVEWSSAVGPDDLE